MDTKMLSVTAIVLGVGLVLGGCASLDTDVEPFRLVEALPPEDSGEPAPEPEDVEVEERWVDFGVVEIESSAGRQERIFANLDGNAGEIRVGMEATIYGDPAKTVVAGEAEIENVGNNFVLFAIESLNFSIDRSAVVSVRVQ